MINSSFPSLAAVPSGWPTLLGLLCILGSKTRLIPISPDQIACEGEDTSSRSSDKRGTCSWGGTESTARQGKAGRHLP